MNNHTIDYCFCLGRAVHRIMKRRGITPRTLKEKSGVPMRRIKQIENCEKIDLHDLDDIMFALKADPEELIDHANSTLMGSRVLRNKGNIIETKDSLVYKYLHDSLKSLWSMYDTDLSLLEKWIDECGLIQVYMTLLDDATKPAEMKYKSFVKGNFSFDWTFIFLHEGFDEESYEDIDTKSLTTTQKIILRDLNRYHSETLEKVLIGFIKQWAKFYNL